MIGSTVLLGLTLAITVGWVYVELTVPLEEAGGRPPGRDDDPDLEV